MEHHLLHLFFFYALFLQSSFAHSITYPPLYGLLMSEGIEKFQTSYHQHGSNLLSEDSAVRRNLAGENSTWQTLSGSPPLVVSRGDNGIFPDQTQLAYTVAKNNSLSNSSAFLCDVQITKDNVLICRTGLDLARSTTINFTFPDLYTELNVNGQTVSGFFSINVTAYQVANNLSAIQANTARPSPFALSITSPYLAYNFTSGPLWINVEYPTFYSQNNFDVGSAIAEQLSGTPIAYLSSPEVGFLKDVQKNLMNSTVFILKFRTKDEIEPSTNQTYGSLLNNLTTISAFASGILVPKDYIWSVNNDSGYLVSDSGLISKAHDANLAIYAYDFVNELFQPSIYNYSFNPVLEYLQYAPSTGPNVDGFFTDFPITASKALACYRSIPSVNQTGKQPLIISHSGASGDYPGCTNLAYDSAVKGGANFIDCPIQMTQDGEPICRGSPNLLSNTDIATNSDLSTRVSSIPQLKPPKGIYTFNLTLKEIQGLKATMDNSDFEGFPVQQNTGYDGQEGILTFAEFLDYAKNQSVNILVDIQNGYFLETQVGINVIGKVLSVLSDAGLNSDRIVIQSEDSAVLKRISETNNYTLAYRVVETNVTITEEVVTEIKALATYVTLPRALIQPTYKSYLLNNSNLVDQFHAQNLSVFVSYLRNIFITIPNDYESDPTAEIDTMVQFFKVDGLITTSPATAKAYLSNGCLNNETEIGGLGYQPSTIIPGQLIDFLLGGYTQVPGPILDVEKNQTTLPLSISPSPSPSPGANVSPSPNATTNGATSTHCYIADIWILVIALVAFQYLMCY